MVALGGSPVNTGGPTTGSPTIIMLQAGGTRTFKWPTFEPDGDAFTCRFGTTAESALPDGQTVPAVPSGGAVPTLTAVSDGCTMTWDLTNAVAGQQYVFHVEFESVHGGVTSSSDIDTVVQITSSPPPAVTGSGVFSATVGQENQRPHRGDLDRRRRRGGQRDRPAGGGYPHAGRVRGQPLFQLDHLDPRGGRSG